MSSNILAVSAAGGFGCPRSVPRSPERNAQSAKSIAHSAVPAASCQLPHASCPSGPGSPPSGADAPLGRSLGRRPQGIRTQRNFGSGFIIHHSTFDVRHLARLMRESLVPPSPAPSPVEGEGWGEGAVPTQEAVSRIIRVSDCSSPRWRRSPLPAALRARGPSLRGGDSSGSETGLAAAASWSD